MEIPALFSRPGENTAPAGTFKHFMYCPWTGLGLYNGFRGNRWLRNRITIFKQFVVPSLQAQTNKDFTLWCSWRPEEKNNPHVKELISYLGGIKEFETVHTFSGVCFWDDKYEPEVARERLLTSLHGAMNVLIDATEGDAGCQWVYMTIQPSDDCYHKNAVEAIQRCFAQHPKLQAVGFTRGFVADYQTLEIAEWNPKTNPPFYTLKFPRPVFIDPLKHAIYTSLKMDAGPYKAGTPLPSHEYVALCLEYAQIQERGFLVGTHSENISTVFKHPFAGERFDCSEVFPEFGLTCSPLQIKYGIRRKILKMLPYMAQRKLRYWAGEKKWILRPLFSLVYDGLRS